MEPYLTIDNVANLVLFVIPGYFAIQTYALIYSKPQAEFSHIFLKSVAYSLPIVSLYALVWREVAGYLPSPTSARYLLPLLMISILLGWAASALRRAKFLQSAGRKLHLPEADDDFLRLQFGKLGKNDPVTVTLKRGDTFLGMPQAGSTLRDGTDRQYTFVLIAWFNQEKHEWEETTGTLLVALSEVLYIQTDTPLE